MKKKSLVKNRIISRCRKRTLKKGVAVLSVAAVLASTVVVPGPVGTVLADDDDGVTEEEEVEEVEQDVLADANGRISFWKWERVTNNNINELFKDNDFHAVLFVKHTEVNGVLVPDGFLSSYGDSEHLRVGKENASTEITRMTSDDYNNSHLFRSLRGGYDEDQGAFLKQDSNGYTIDNSNFYKKVFFTTGDCKGCFWVRNRGIATNDEDDYYTNTNNKVTGPTGYTGSYGEHGNTQFMYMDIALSRGEAKDDPDDMSYLDIGTGQDKNKDWFIHPNYTPDNDSDSNCEAKMDLNHDAGGHMFQLEAFRFDPNYELWSIYCNHFNEGHYRSNLIYSDGYITQSSVYYSQRDNHCGVCYLSGSFEAGWGDQNISFCATGTIWGMEKVYAVYAGTQYVFSSLKGEKDPSSDVEFDNSGAGGILKVGKGQIQAVGETYYQDHHGNSAKSDGCVIPEDSIVRVEEGGILSVSGNLLNKGKIVLDGGVLIIRDGGTVTPYTETKQGSIECMNGGSIIIMPGGKLFTNPNNDGKPDLTLSNGSNLIDYGLWVNYYASVDASSKIEVRKSGALLACAGRTDDTYMYKNATVSSSGKDTVKVTNTSKSTAVANGTRGIVGMNGDPSDAGTIVVESNAAFDHTSGVNDYTAQLNVTRLTY